MISNFFPYSLQFLQIVSLKKSLNAILFCEIQIRMVIGRSDLNSHQTFLTCGTRPNPQDRYVLRYIFLSSFPFITYSLQSFPEQQTLFASRWLLSYHLSNPLSTISRIICLKEIFCSQPSFRRALVGSPRRESTSVGLK